MSRFTNAYAPPPPAVQATPFKRRPTWATVFGIVCVVFGILGILGSAWGLIGAATGISFSPSGVGADDAEMLEALHAIQRQHQLPLIVSGVVTLLMTVWLLLIGVWLLRTKAWIRRVALAYAWLDIAVTIGATFVTARMQFAMMDVMVELMTRQLRSGAASTPAGMEDVMATVVRFATVGGVVIGLAFGLALPILLIWWLSRAKVKAQIAAWSGDGDALPPYSPYQPPSAS